jgi:DinB family protein
MSRRPEPREAATYYFKYIDRVPGTEVVGVLAQQERELPRFLSSISEERSLHRYAADKWSFRQVLNHVNDCERLFQYRAFWFARGFDSALPSFEQDVAASCARADDVSWAAHIEEFRAVRASTLAFFRNLPTEAWDRMGVASDNPFSVRALAFTIAGHADHHAAILRERYV